MAHTTPTRLNTVNMARRMQDDSMPRRLSRGKARQYCCTKKPIMTVRISAGSKIMNVKIVVVMLL